MFARIVILSLLPTACASPPPAPAWRVEAFRESTELDRVDVEADGGARTALRNQKRRRTGARAALGDDGLAIEAELFHEDFVGDHDGHGASLAVAGAPRILRFADDSHLVLPYRLRAAFVDGGALRVDDRAGSYSYVEAVAELGVGWDAGAFRPSVGVAVDTLRGDVDEHDAAPPRRVITTSCTAGYVDLRFRPSGSGFTAGVRALVGEEQGARWSLGWRF